LGIEFSDQFAQFCGAIMLVFPINQLLGNLLLERLLLGIKLLKFGLSFRRINFPAGKDLVQAFNPLFDRCDLLLALDYFGFQAG